MYRGNFIDYKQLKFWGHWEVPQQNEDFLQSKDDFLQIPIAPDSAYVLIQSLKIFYAWTDDRKIF